MPLLVPFSPSGNPLLHKVSNNNVREVTANFSCAMSETKRERRWRRQRRVMQALAAGGLICAAIYLWLSLFPALTRRLKSVAPVRRTGAVSRVAKSSPSRRVYPYSVIRGGAYSAAELAGALDRDSVAARHYLLFRRASVRTTGSSFAEPVFLSYRLGNAIYWTNRPVRLPPNETLLTDGEHYARARCGNRISRTPQTPVNDTEPAPETLNTPLPPANTIGDLNTWSEDRLTPAAAPPFTQLLPSLAGPISAVPELSFPSGTIPSWWVNSPPSGFLAPPVTTGPTLSLIPPGGTGPVIQPNPIPGWSLPPTTVAPTGFTPGLPPTGPVPSTPVVAVVPPYIFPPDIWPTVPILPLVPGLPTIPQTPTQPTGPVQPVPEPGLLLPTLLACAAFAVAKSRWGRRRTPPSPITPRPPASE